MDKWSASANLYRDLMDYDASIKKWNEEMAGFYRRQEILTAYALYLDHLDRTEPIQNVIRRKFRCGVPW